MTLIKQHNHSHDAEISPPGIPAARPELAAGQIIELDCQSVTST
jgi:hypothetical protein